MRSSLQYTLCTAAYVINALPRLATNQMNFKGAQMCFIENVLLMH